MVVRDTVVTDTFQTFKGLFLWIPVEPTPCEGMPDIFCPEEDIKKHDHETYAKSLCIERCPLRAECLKSALKEEEGLVDRLRTGIRGGYDAIERSRMDKTLHRNRRIKFGNFDDTDEQGYYGYKPQYLQGS